MTTRGFSARRLARIGDVLRRYVDDGHIPGAVAVVARHGEVHTESVGNLAFEGAGSRTSMAPDTIFRITSMTKPITAACTMTLVEECSLRLDDPVDELLPELAEMRVLADADGPLDDTVAAERSITLRDLLTFRLGTGAVLAPPGASPIGDAMAALELGQGAPDPDVPPPPDEWIRRLGNLPLMYQPGERWMYNTGSDVLGVLIARCCGKSLAEVLHERIFEPLGMRDTGFFVSSEDVARLATEYVRDRETGDLVVHDTPDGRWSSPPAFEAGGGGLVSSAEDYLAFAAALLAGGAYNGERVLAPPSVTLMATDHLTAGQKAVSGLGRGFFDDVGWGFGVSVTTRRTQLGPSVGSYSWTGGFGTLWSNDPAEDLVTIIMTQRMLESAAGAPIFFDFLTAAYQAIDD